MEKSLKFIYLSLQQGIVVDMGTQSCNAVYALVSNRKKLVVCRPEFKGFTLDILKTLPRGFGVPENFHIRFGDAFRCDTWDRQIENFSHLHTIEL